MPSLSIREPGSSTSQYIPEKGPHGAATQSGKVIVRVQGLINTTGVLSPIYAGIN